eukprot:scaffold128190_cov18-Tisochrysis_lutea.AAC.1
MGSIGGLVGNRQDECSETHVIFRHCMLSCPVPGQKSGLACSSAADHRGMIYGTLRLRIGEAADERHQFCFCDYPYLPQFSQFSCRPHTAPISAPPHRAHKELSSTLS